MEAFLEQVAGHYFRSGGMEDMCFIFANRRSLAFFKKYVSQCVAASGKAMLSPRLCTINEFVYSLSDAVPTDRIHLILELYEVYRTLNSNAEPLDDFIFWGGVILSDFDDVDKYLVDAEKLFTNVSDFRKLQDSFDYLSPTQEAAIRRFAENFRTPGKYKEEFRRIWDILLPLYKVFNGRLSSKGMCYEGAAYRALAESLSSTPVVDILSQSANTCSKYVFVGLNALNECEKKILSKMRDARIAEFCWDYSSEQIRDTHNKSSFFMASNVVAYPQAFDPAPCPSTLPQINVLSVPSCVGQAKQLPSILEKVDARGIETAVVLPDESMLIPVLNSIPRKYQDINVTMGYPMSGSELWSLMNDISSLQMHLRCREGRCFFYHRQVWGIFSNSIFKSLMGDEGEEKCKAVRKEARYYIPEEELRGIPVFDAVFKPVVKDPAECSAEIIHQIQDYQLSLLSFIGNNLKDIPEMALEIDFSKEYYQVIGELSACNLAVLPSTYFKLLSSLARTRSVPFLGEPLKGLQIMGPLETRSLDFKNLVILNCNEGMFPRHNVSSSFVPAELRKGFGLPTYEYQDAVWAYYFYRLIQRAGSVWMLYDSRPDVGRSGEESRYIKQLELHFGARINRYVAKSSLMSAEVPMEIPKTPEDISRLKEVTLSVSALQNYQKCPVKFYYHTLCGLKPDSQVSESLDAGMLGTVFHSSMETLYKKNKGIISEDYIKGIRDSEIKQLVDGFIMETMHGFEVVGRNIIYSDLVCRYVRNTLRSDLELMKRYGCTSFRVFETEYKKFGTVRGFKFIGIIDRLDSFSPSEIRVVDYKTGRLDDEKVNLQLYIYDLLLEGDRYAAGKKVVNSVYHMMSLFSSPVSNYVQDPEKRKEMEETVDGILSELSDPLVPFRRVTDEKKCEYCDFKTICGR